MSRKVSIGLFLTVSLLPLTGFGDELNDNQQALSPQLADLCQTASKTVTLSNECNTADYTSAAYVAQVAPDEITALPSILLEASDQQVRSIQLQLGGQRNPTVAADSKTETPARFNLFLTASDNQGDQDDTTYEEAYESSTEHSTLSLNYQATQPWLIGLALGRSNTKLDQAGPNEARQKINHYLLYSSWYRDNFSTDITLGYAEGELETKRQLPGGLATGSSDNQLQYLNIQGAYDFVDGAWRYGPLASLSLAKFDTDAFTEQGQSPWNTQIKSQTSRSTIYGIGVQGAYQAQQTWGLLLPFGKLEWRKEFKDRSTIIKGLFIDAPDKEFVFTTDSPHRYWFHVEAGIQGRFKGGLSLILSYSEVIGYRDTQLQAITGGIHWAF